MKYKGILFAALSLCLLFSGCNSRTVKKTPAKSPKIKASTPAPTNASDEVKYYAPYTGEEVSKEVSENIAFMTIIENSAPARPQSGLNAADIVYEAMAEGGITRFFAIFQSRTSDKIGPVRSMRTYFIDLAYEYNLPFGHAGGSHDALDRIKKEGLMSMNEFYNSLYYWRDKTIKIQEHSLYTSSKRLTDLVKAKGYVKQPAVNLKFDKAFWDNLTSKSGSTVTIKFNGSYTTSYDFKDGLYYKSMNNKPTLNKEDGDPVAVKNIVIQNVNYSKRLHDIYLDAALIGTGDGYIISNGKMIKVTWSKADLKSQTIFKDESGNIVPLNPGKTWWHLLDQNAKLTIQ